MMKRIIGLLVVFLLISSSLVFSAVDYSEGIADKSSVIATAVSVTSERYPDSDTVIVDQSDLTTYETNDTSVKWGEIYLKILTEKGRRANTTVSSYFTIPYQRGTNDCNIPMVEIVKPDGNVITVDVEKQSKVMINPGSMSANIYNPNDKLVRVNVANLEVGDLLHIVMFDRTVKARMENTWSDWLMFEGTHPILHRLVEISAPAEMPLRSIALKSKIPGTVQYSKNERGGRIIYRWEINNVPRMFPEPKMPSYNTVVQRLLISTIPDWETVSKWYWKISEPHYEVSAEMRKKVAELTDGFSEDDEKIRKIFEFVSQEIRYMGITVEDTAPGYEPHDVKDTFKDRSGVCRDKAGLLVAMLRIAGFDAFPVLIMVGPLKDTEVPQPYFNHAITAVLKNGKYILMDSTDETTSKLLPAYLNHKSYLVARPEGETLLTSPIEPAEDNMMKIKTSGRVTKDGDLRCETEMLFEGINDNTYRRYFANAKEEQRKLFVEGIVRRRMPGARVISVEMTPADMMNMSVPLTIKSVYEVSDILVGNDAEIMIPVPKFGANVGVLNLILGGVGLEKRKYPLKTGLTCGISEQIRIKLPAELKEVISLPDNNPISDDSLSFYTDYIVSNSELNVTGEFKLKTVEFSTNEYLVLKKALKDIQITSRKMPIFSKTAVDGSADILVLRDDVVYDVNSSTHWRTIRDVEKKILTYAGKKKNGEIKVSYNPDWESVLVTNVVVMSPDGTLHRPTDKEFNIMDASWVASAPRYPVEKIMVVSLPGVEIGSIIKYRIIRENNKGKFFATRKYFNSYNPVEESSIKIIASPDIKFKVNQYSFTGSYTNYMLTTGMVDKVVMFWSDKGKSAVKSEDSLPPWWTFNETVLISAGDWGEYAKRVNKVFLSAAKKNTKVKKVVKSIIKGANSPAEKVKLIRDYVVTHIRLAGPGFTGLPYEAIMSADITLEDGYGNMADRAILLYSMLRIAGFRPDFVLTSFNPDMDIIRDNIINNPSHIFGSVLVRLSDKKLDLPEGKYIYLNDTDQYAVLGASIYEHNLSLTLVNGKIEKVMPVKSSRLETKYAITLKDNGDALITPRIYYYGKYYGRTKKQYEEMTPEKFERHYQSLISGIAQGAKRIGKLVYDFDNYPGMVTFSVAVPSYAILADNQYYFVLPETMRGLFSVRADKRINPMYMSGDTENDLSVKVEVPRGYKVEIKPRSFRCEDVGGIDLDISVTGDDNCLRYVAKAIMKPSIVSPVEYKALLELDKCLSHKRASTVLLTKKK